MQTTAELAGLFVAHQLWYASQGAVITPTLVYELLDGTRQISRITMPNTQAAVAYGEEWLAENPEHAARAVLVADGFLELQQQKFDAVIFQCRCYVEPTGEFAGAVPYRQASTPTDFAVFPLQFLATGQDDLNTKALAEAFFAGVDRHAQASILWDENFEELPASQ